MSVHFIIILLFGSFFLLFIKLWDFFSKKALYGSARFASEWEIRRAGLREKKGILLGKFHGKYLIFGGDEHVLLYSPTRAGKGVGVVIPNLLNWSDSAIVLDVKKENWHLTSGFRKKNGQDVYLFDPFSSDGRTACYNPLSYVALENTIDLYDDLQRIAMMLFPSSREDVDPFWNESARTAFLAIGGYIAETPGKWPFTIGEILRKLSKSSDELRELGKIVKTRDVSDQCKHAICDFVGASENTFQSVRKVVTARLGLWMNLRVDLATSANDFDLRDLRRKPMTLYLGVNPGNLRRLSPLLNLMFQQAVDLNTRLLPEHDLNLRYQLLLMMDEFRVLGNVEVLTNAIAYLAGYGIRVITIVQSLAQLKEVYGPYTATNYRNNHAIEIVFTPKEQEIAKELSERFGYMTVKARSTSRSMKSASSETLSDHQRALILPQELVLTSFKDEYLIKGGIRPIKAKKIFYYKDEIFKKRILSPPEVSIHSSFQVSLSYSEKRSEKRKAADRVVDEFLLNEQLEKESEQEVEEFLKESEEVHEGYEGNNIRTYEKRKERES
jgi:type IV secretion system protein VirD4